MSLSTVASPPANFKPKRKALLEAAIRNLKNEANRRDDPILAENVEKIRDFFIQLDDGDDDENNSFYDSITLSQNYSRQPRTSMGPHFLDGIQEVESDGNVLPQKIEENYLNKLDVPFWVEWIPNLVIIAVISVYLVLGTYILKFLDPKLDGMAFHELLLLPYMICSTIGWGHITATVNPSRVFEIIYAMIGVPLTFAFLANIGRLITAICTSDQFLFIKYLKIKKEKEKSEIKQLSISTAFSLFAFHMFCAIPLFGLFFDELKVAPALYFNFISIGCIGYGDIYPKPKNIFHAILMIIFFSVGVVITGALFVAICIKLHKVIFVNLEDLIFKISKKLPKRKIATEMNGKNHIQKNP